MSKIFNIEGIPGFTAYVIDNADYNDIIKKTELEKMYFIPAGLIPPNPSEILGSRYFERLPKKLHEDFEMIILDAPPILAVTDAEILSRIAAATILIVRAEKQKRTFSKNQLSFCSTTQFLCRYNAEQFQLPRRLR